MGRLRELLPWGAGVLMGGWLGGVVAAGAAGKTFSPAHWYWPVTWTCLGVGTALMVGYLLIGVVEDRERRSPALAMRFAEEESDSRMQFIDPRLPRHLSTTSLSASASPITSLPPLAPMELPNAEIVRLYVENLRKHALRAVHVRLEKIRTVQSDKEAHHRDWLKWMHDDTPEHPRSIAGMELTPKRHEFVDLATYVYWSEVFAVDYAVSNLRGRALPLGSYFIHVVGVGQDEEGRQIPERHAAFELRVAKETGFTVIPRTVEECGFSPQGRGVEPRRRWGKRP